MNLITKFRKFFDGLSVYEQKDLWDIMTALRSDDTGGEELKAFTTCRIRGELLGCTGVDGSKYGAYIALSLSKAKMSPFTVGEYSKKRVLELMAKKATTHWSSHLDSAIKALQKHRPAKNVEDLTKFKCF